MNNVKIIIMTTNQDGSVPVTEKKKSELINA